MPVISQTSKQPFAEGEKRVLTIRAERIDPKYLTDGEPPSIEARLVEIDTTQQRRGPRKYTLTGLARPVGIDLWNNDTSDDEARLAAIAEDLLAEQEAPGTAGGWPDTGGISPRDAGGL